VEPPELEHLNYVVDVPKAQSEEFQTEDTSQTNIEGNTKSKSDTKLESETSIQESKSEVKTDEDQSNELQQKKFIEGTPLLVTLK